MMPQAGAAPNTVTIPAAMARPAQGAAGKRARAHQAGRAGSPAISIGFVRGRDAVDVRTEVKSR